MDIEIIPFDEQQAFEAGLLIVATRAPGLSFGDRACLALAKRLAAPAVTADSKWADIAAAVGVTVQLIR